MAAEAFTYTGARIASDVKDKFGDVGGVQITDTMIIRWINDGQREVIKGNPFLQKIGTGDLIANQQEYPFSTYFPGVRILQYDGINLNGIPAKIIPFGEYQAKIVAAGVQTMGGDMGSEAIATVYGGSIFVWPIPQATIIGGLVIYYIAYPADIATLADTLTVPDRFYNALQAYVFGQALMLDENWTAASAVLQASGADLRAEFERENRSPDDFYPVIVDTETAGDYNDIRLDRRFV